MREHQTTRLSTGRVTLIEVAHHAGVSRATASLVLRESPLVAGPTRQRVLSSMRDLGYVYHRGAASLRTRRSHSVGLVITDISNPFYSELTAGIEATLDAANYVVMLANTAESLEKQDRLLATLHENNADGVLFCPSVGTPRATIDALSRWRLPVVLLVRYLAGLELDYVGADNALGAEMAVEHLIAHGHHRIAFIGGPATSSARYDRVQGFQAALQRRRLPMDQGLMPTSPPTRVGGYEAILALLARDEPPTAALCYNDMVAFGVSLGLQRNGYTPGRDFAVIGFDDVAEAALWHPALTTVATTPRQIGVAAAELLLSRMNHPQELTRQIILSPTLVIRSSCGPHSEQAASCDTPDRGREAVALHPIPPKKHIRDRSR
ncbi:MAG TPA: LacI family DNA-binding transcriptional regulator [Chloroflexota bacterium]|nr:LacI family DNA-binding transcriptional regulator [Chloroflexota bacterium]